MGLDKLSQELLKLSKSLSNEAEVKAFLKKSGNKLKNKTLNIAKSRVKEHTGNYIKSIKRGKVYEFKGALAVRTYSTAPHAHLLEYGYIKKDRSGKEHGFKRGHYVFTTAEKEFEKEYYDDTEKFINEILEKNRFK